MRKIAVVIICALLLVSCKVRQDVDLQSELIELQEANRAWATAYAELENAMATQFADGE